jgi:hypothetical protein
MVFTKRLRERVRRGEITCSIRFWIGPRVKVGARYRMDEGEIKIDSVEQIELADITPQLARESGFLGVADLLKVARHGKGENIYLIRFHYLHSLQEPHATSKTGQKT